MYQTIDNKNLSSIKLEKRKSKYNFPFFRAENNRKEKKIIFGYKLIFLFLMQFQHQSKKFCSIWQSFCIVIIVNIFYKGAVTNMNKLYLVIIFSGLTFFTQAQTGKNGETNFMSADVPSKVVKLYPNPAYNIINFEFSKPVQKDYTLQVFNFVGKKVYELNAVSQKTSVPVAEFYRGIYIFQLRDKSGRIIESGKFQVSK